MMVHFRIDAQPARDRGDARAGRGRRRNAPGAGRARRAGPGRRSSAASAPARACAGASRPRSPSTRARCTSSIPRPVSGSTTTRKDRLMTRHAWRVFGTPGRPDARARGGGLRRRRRRGRRRRRDDGDDGDGDDGRAGLRRDLGHRHLDRRGAEVLPGGPRRVQGRAPRRTVKYNSAGDNMPTVLVDRGPGRQPARHRRRRAAGPDEAVRQPGAR